jgi:CRP-like cAMP-binding protein/1-acyl-sn-glycerol-3-phosphate acyltransferase
MSRRAQQILENSPFFEGFVPHDIAQLAAFATFVNFEAGQEIFAEDELAVWFYVLVSGSVDLSFGGPSTADAKVTVVQTVSHSGYPLGWSSMVEPFAYRATATARERTRLLAIPRDALERYAGEHPEFGVTLMRAIIGLVGDRVRAMRLRLIARRYDDDVRAIRQLLSDSDDVLPLASPLHKIAHYLENRLTLDDAFHTLDVLRLRGNPAEQHVAELCADILSNIRRELDLYQQLQAIYDAVANAPPDMDPEEVRRRSLVEFRRLFAGTRHRIVGQHRLPDRSGQIFIMNHLQNHPDNLLPNNFILTLDTHFVAGMLLLEKYGEAPIRVIRKSRPDEYGHQKFYDRLGYIYTFSGYVDPDPGDLVTTPDDRRRFFFEAAAGYLRLGRNILICPEGASVSTEESPVRFRPGAFELAAYVRPEPLIVPIAVANFDKKITRTTTAAVVHSPFLLSSYVADPTDHEALIKFLNDQLVPRFRTWVRDAIQLAG